MYFFMILVDFHVNTCPLEKYTMCTYRPRCMLFPPFWNNCGFFWPTEFFYSLCIDVCFQYCKFNQMSMSNTCTIWQLTILVGFCEKQISEGTQHLEYKYIWLKIVKMDYFLKWKSLGVLIAIIDLLPYKTIGNAIHISLVLL